jgi:transposase
VWFVLEEVDGLHLDLVNSRNMRMVPGRKTDVGDAGWIAQLLEVGLLRGSFVPAQVIRELRDLTRYRKRLTQDNTREQQRVDKVLEDAGIKLGSVASQTLGKSGRAMIDALIAGERDPMALAELAQRRLRSKIPELQRALVGRFGDHHASMLKLHLAHIDHLDRLVADLDAQIEAKLVPFVDTARRYQTITGVGPLTAQVLVAEIGADMSVFPTADHLASWCGVCPGNNQSAGKQKSGRTNMASPWLTDALVQAAWAASRSKNTWMAARFWRLARRIGKKKAIIATAHAIIVALWHMQTNGCDYSDLGTDWWDKRSSTAAETARLKRRLEALGHNVTLTSAA